MRIRRPTQFLLIVLFLPVLFGLSGCPWSTDSKKPDDGGNTGYLEQTTITNVLQNLKKAYVEMNPDEYEKLLGHSQGGDAYDFEYIFDPNDVGGDDNIPPSWGFDDEMVATRNMFSKSEPNHDGYIAETIELSFDAGTPTPANDVNPGWQKVQLTGVNLYVDTRQSQSGENLRYLVSGDQADLYFAKTGNIWKIVRWVDRPIGLVAARQQS
ncbi:MAG: hypothetical protein ACE15D_01915 [Candidatus Eisenbacteria bacterium]